MVNFDPDAAGREGRREASIRLLLEEGMQVRIVELDGGLDPDEYCKERGADAYRERIESAKGYFHWLADRARKQFDMRTTEGKVAVLKYLVPAVQRSPIGWNACRSPTRSPGIWAWTNQGMVLDTFRSRWPSAMIT